MDVALLIGFNIGEQKMPKSRSEIIGFCNLIAIVFFILTIIGFYLNEYDVSIVTSCITLIALTVRLNFLSDKNAKKKKDN